MNIRPITLSVSVVFSLLFTGIYFYTVTAKKAFRRVYVDMVADLFHPGHVAFLKQAIQFGDYLIVGLNNDEDCASYKRKPIMTQDERVAAVSACKYVDEVLPNAPLRITEEWIDKHKIDVVVHGDDFNKDFVNEYYGVALKRGIFKTVPYTKGISTSQLIGRIKARDHSSFIPKYKHA